MVVRAIFNYIAAIVILIAFEHQNFIKQNVAPCHWQAAIFLFSLYMATVYYALICWELYLTLKNPFRAPTSGSFIFHIIITSFCVMVVSSLAIAKRFEYRDEFKVCFMKETNSISLWNICFIYIPVFGIVIGGFIALGWSVRKLKSTIIDETFELRWTLIRQQTAIITCFTINYGLQAISWSVLFWWNTQNFSQNPNLDINPYLLSIFCVIACVFDAVTWFIRKWVKKIHQIQSSFSSMSMGPLRSQNNRPNMMRRMRTQKNIKNISDALRKEVITCIVDGLGQCIKRMTRLSFSVSNRAGSDIMSVNNGRGGGGTMTDNLIPKKKGKRGGYDSFSEELEDEISADHQIFEMGTGFGAVGSQVLLSNYYPKKIDGKPRKNVIEQYEVNLLKNDLNKQQKKKENKVIFTDFAPKVFGYLRRTVYGISDEEYYESILPDGSNANKISLDLVAKFSEGRSGAFFFFTKDMKYLIKTLTKSEAQLLLDTLQQYVNHMKDYPKTYLSKYFGLHSIKLYGHNIYFVVNKNIFSSLDKKPDEIYDLKVSIQTMVFLSLSCLGLNSD